MVILEYFNRNQFKHIVHDNIMKKLHVRHKSYWICMAHVANWHVVCPICTRCGELTITP